MGDSSSPALFLQSSARLEPDGGQLRTRRFHNGNRHGTVEGYAESKELLKEFFGAVPVPDQGLDPGGITGPRHGRICHIGSWRCGMHSVYRWGVNNSLALLGLLSRQPSYGYDLKHSYDRYFGTGKALAFGQVYSTLARMVRDELIRALGGETGSGPDRKKYEITSAGQVKVHEWLFTPDVPSESLQSNLFAKTVIALLLDDDADRLLDVQRSEHMTRMRELTRLKKDADLMQVLMCDHGLFHIEADLRWIDLTGARLTQLKKELQSA